MRVEVEEAESEVIVAHWAFVSPDQELKGFVKTRISDNALSHQVALL